MSFDPDAAAVSDSGIFGLPFTREEAHIILTPVPFDATTSYRRGTARGPQIIQEASMQVDLYDRRLGKIYAQGIYMEEEDASIAALGEKAAHAAEPIIEAGGVENLADSTMATKLLTQVNTASEHVNQFTFDATRKVLATGKIPGLIGGDHATPFGAIRAVAEQYKDIGILHIDAHMDFRDAFEGFTWSHASIMHNVLSRIPAVTKMVQVGIRDFGQRELEFAQSQGKRVDIYFDDQIAQRLLEGEKYSALCKEIIAKLPDNVYISFDIDGLDPSLCPDTGTPVPGGLSFHQTAFLLEALKSSGKHIVGFDLVEVSNNPESTNEINGVVGARMLYKLCGLFSR